MSLPLWAPNSLWKDPKQAGCKTKMQQMLREAGLTQVEDLFGDKGDHTNGRRSVRVCPEKLEEHSRN
jgi:hypothetical protein